MIGSFWEVADVGDVQLAHDGVVFDGAFPCGFGDADVFFAFEAVFAFELVHLVS